MDGERERGEGGNERRREGATERVGGAREERGRKGDRKGGKLQWMYHDEDTGQYIQYITHITTQNAALGTWCLIGNPSEVG